MVNLVVTERAASAIQCTPFLRQDDIRVAEQVPETHDGVLAVLDQLRLGTVTDVLPRRQHLCVKPMQCPLTTSSPLYETAQAI